MKDLPAPPRTFISYSWDDEEHKVWVRRLATRLRMDGIDARLDHWHLSGRTIPEFMNSEVRKAERVLIVCTPTYRDKVHAVEDGLDMRGSGWESMLLGAEMLGGTDRGKLVPVLARGAWSNAAPSWLSGFDWVDLSDPASFEKNYREVLRRLTGSSAKIPTLGRLPADLEPEPVTPLFVRQPDDAEPAQQMGVKLLLGVAVDLSGSMTQSIRNESGPASRLEGFRLALDRLVLRARESVTGLRGRRFESEVDVFVYGFGLRHKNLEHGDLLSLLLATRSTISPTELESIKQQEARRVEREYRRKASGYSGLADLARSAGFGGLVSQAEEMARRAAEDEVRNRVLGLVFERASAEMERIGDTTVSLEELGQMWEESGEAFSDAEQMIYGLTPMASAMTAVEARLRRELALRGEETQAVLFLLSDGEPTDGDPGPALERIRELGVTVVCCYVTDEDVADPRRLYGAARPHWQKATHLMFSAASTVDEDSDFANFLIHKGWIIDEGGRLFVQVNHSDVLEEFINVALAPLHERSDGWQLPMGE